MRQKPVRIAPPDFGSPMEATHASEEARRLLALRRSGSADRMTEPGPDEQALAAILEMAARVPDHRKLTPFRFIVFTGDARARAGAMLAARFAALNPDADRSRVEIERGRFMRAPVVVALVASFVCNHKTPEWEQALTTGAAGINLLLAASSFGFAGNWLTEWYGYDDKVAEAFGLAAGEKFAGFFYLGTAAEAPLERQRPDMSAIVSIF